jgi:cellulose synthase/poly-beta-1,6-N-acetylglucosamine synthase-like glycosyltransferase
MIERTLLIIWGIWLLLILVAAFRVLGFLSARRRQDRLWGKGARNQQPVALIVPVKGFDLQATPRFFDMIFGQDYSDYRVIVCFESWDDPVAQWLSEHLEAGPGNPVWTHPQSDDGLRSITLVCAGVSEGEGQKVHNQIAAFADLTSRDAVIAFADADIVCGPDWLARLVAPINQGTHPLSTTYRWLVPKRPTFPNQIASVINGSIATQGGGEMTNVLWGGSMALSREVFLELDVPRLLSGSLNDDLRLSKAARKAGHKIAFVRSLIIPTMIDFNWRTFFEFAKRQYTQVKFFSPILYTGVNVVLGFYVLGAASIVAAIVYGYFPAWIPVAAAYIIDQFRALARQQIYLSLFQENGIRQKLFAAGWLEHMLTPFWILIHWMIVVSTWTQDKITWAGIRYRLRSPSKTQILFRPVSAERLPAGVPGLAMLGALHDQSRRGYTQSVRTLQKTEEMPVTYTPTEEETTEVTVTDLTPKPVGAEEIKSQTIGETPAEPPVENEATAIPLEESSLKEETQPDPEVPTESSTESPPKVLLLGCASLNGETEPSATIEPKVLLLGCPSLQGEEKSPEEVSETEPKAVIEAVSAPAIEKLPAPRISHPGGPSAVIPITTAFYERREHKSFRLSARERGSLSAMEAALMKTRVVPAFLHPTRHQTAESPRPSGVSVRLPFVPGAQGNASATTATTARTVSAPAVSEAVLAGTTTISAATSSSLTFPLVREKSSAARRPNAGGHNQAPHRGTAALSSRASWSSRGNTHAPEARPVNRRSSSRP